MTTLVLLVRRGSSIKPLLCGIKGIKMEFSNARAPQQNEVAERKNRTLIEAARTMLADSLLLIPFWAEAVNTACYVQNKVLINKPHNKTPYELLIGRAPIISFIRPFGCPVTILNTLDHLGKFDGKADKGFLVGYSINSKAFRVYNSKTKKVKENLHVNFLENKPNVAGSGPEWLFDIDSLTNSMNYQPVSAKNRTNGIAGLKIQSNVGQEGKEKVYDQKYILLPVLNTSSDVPSCNEEVESSPKDDAGKKSIEEPTCVEGGKIVDLGCLDQQMKSIDDSENTNSINNFNTASPTVNTASDKDETFQRTYGKWNFSTLIPVNDDGSSFSHPAALDDFSKMPNLEDTRIFNDAYDERDKDAKADYNNLETVFQSVPFSLKEFTKIIPKNKSLEK
uniref:Ribonuclease H-like domain-containing protein n=1 Tax=Tanacetum cinerariifolium TaxID=118510 RepID=A0A699JHL6_TANCI|nr:ribonuclease H-like domain-containing protein [Tanacetum cinerariifolium]